MSDPMMNDHSLSCQDVMQQLWDYLDHELTEERMAAVKAHLAVCTRCFPQYDFERTFLEALRAGRGERLAPGHLRQRVVAALRAGMREA